MPHLSPPAPLLLLVNHHCLWFVSLEVEVPQDLISVVLNHFGWYVSAEMSQPLDCVSQSSLSQPASYILPLSAGQSQGLLCSAWTLRSCLLWNPWICSCAAMITVSVPSFRLAFFFFTLAGCLHVHFLYLSVIHPMHEVFQIRFENHQSFIMLLCICKGLAWTQELKLVLKDLICLINLKGQNLETLYQLVLIVVHSVCIHF